MPTRTMSKQDWRRARYEHARASGDAYRQMLTAYDWLRAAVTDLPQRRHPDAAVRRGNKELANELAGRAAGRLLELGAQADAVCDYGIRQLARRREYLKLARSAHGDAERIRRAADAMRWSAAQALKLTARRTIPAASKAAASDVYERVMAEACHSMAALASRAEEGYAP